MKRRQKKFEGGSAARLARGQSDFLARKSRTPEDLFLSKRKSLGQHFLHNPHYLRLIADAGNIKEGETIVEIGPGDGALTEELLSRGAQVIAIEKDSRLVPVLKEKFKNYDIAKFKVIEADALHYDISKYVRSGGYKVVGNIPYYITGALFKKFLSGKVQPSTLVFLIQKEVAERIARHGSSNKKAKESILSLSIKAYGTPHYVKTVPRGAFSPPPNVDSAIVGVYDISYKNFVDAEHEKRFFELVKKGFAQKRKLLKSNLKSFLRTRSNILKNVGISEKARAEDVPLPKWLDLSRA